MIEVADYSNVTIANNQFQANDGMPSYFPNTIWVPCITLQGVLTATIEKNACNNAWDIWDTTSAQFKASEFAPTSGVTECGNVYWLTEPVSPTDGSAPTPAMPKYDAPCPTTVTS
jgi:hypothetical protein